MDRVRGAERESCFTTHPLCPRTQAYAPGRARPWRFIGRTLLTRPEGNTLGLMTGLGHRWTTLQQHQTYERSAEVVEYGDFISEYHRLLRASGVCCKLQIHKAKKYTRVHFTRVCSSKQT